MIDEVLSKTDTVTVQGEYFNNPVTEGKLFPDVNLSWLITGTPPMLLTAQSELESAQKELAYLREKVTMQEDIIKLMKRAESGDKPQA